MVIVRLLDGLGNQLFQYAWRTWLGATPEQIVIAAQLWFVARNASAHNLCPPYCLRL